MDHNHESRYTCTMKTYVCTLCKHTILENQMALKTIIWLVTSRKSCMQHRMWISKTKVMTTRKQRWNKEDKYTTIINSAGLCSLTLVSCWCQTRLKFIVPSFLQMAWFPAYVFGLHVHTSTYYHLHFDMTAKCGHLFIIHHVKENLGNVSATILHSLHANGWTDEWLHFAVV